MKKLIINCIGPIKHVELNLKRINVIIGPQSAGKSCILKIACFCAWVEKRFQIEQSADYFADDDFVYENLIAFHKLEGYFDGNSSFEYQTSTMRLVYQYADHAGIKLSWKKNHWDYKRTRISYIPAERNLVAAIPNWLEVNLGNNYIRNFISDWNISRQLNDREHRLKVMNLGVNYFYDSKSGKDYVVLENGHSLSLTNASSGLQSIIPMWVYLEYLFRQQYQTNTYSSVKNNQENEAILSRIYDVKYANKIKRMDFADMYIGQIGRFGNGKLFFANETDYEECMKLYEAYTQTNSSDIYLEEPEQNLFPLAQIDLVYSLLQEMDAHGDGLFMATHSPYILYALNNCMLGYNIKHKISDRNQSLRKHEHSWINPKDVAVWELKDGELSSEIDSRNMTLQDADGLIRENYFDRVMKLIMSEFTNYSAYYE